MKIDEAKKEIDEVRKEIDQARKKHKEEIDELTQFTAKHTNLSAPTKGRGHWNSKLFKYLYWWVIELKDEVDIYGVKYNKIYLMPYTFGLTEEDLNPNKKTAKIELDSYPAEEKIQDKYKKFEHDKLERNFDVTTGNIHPEDWKNKIKTDGKIKQLMLVRNISGAHYGVLFGTNILNKEKEKEFIILQSDSDKYYIPKKCIKLIKEDQKVEEALKDFFR